MKSYYFIKSTKSRQSGAELLRIVAMLLIMFHHFAIHGGVEYNNFSINNAWLNVIDFGGKIGVNIFVLITGFYSCNSSFSIKKIIKILFATEFYSLSLMIVSVAIGAQEMRIMLLVRGLFPLIFGNGYWFISCYIIMYIISPILNAGVNKISRRGLAAITVFLLGIYCIIPNTIGIIKPTNDYEFSVLIWFIVLYLIGSYFRKYSFVLLHHRMVTGIVLLFSTIILLYSKTYLLYVGDSFSGLSYKIISNFSNISQNALMPFLISVFAFCFFQPLNFKANKLFFDVAKATFGVYLIHDSPMIYKFIWENIIHTKEVYYSEYYILASIILVLLLYIVCTLIEILRLRFVEQPIFNSKRINLIILHLEKKFRDV